MTVELVWNGELRFTGTAPENTVLFDTAPCVVASLLMQTNTVGGSAVAEHTAVAVMP